MSSSSPTSGVSAPEPRPDLTVEFLVEPFAEGKPGPHVDAAVEAFASRDMEVEVGPFASLVTGSADVVPEAVADLVRQAMAAGATSLRIHVGADPAELTVAPLHDALPAMIRAAEREIGSTTGEWSRADKQQVVRMLENQGAFLLRGAVDDMARIMGVSRITIYNYLNALD
jgi:uncharacterized protein YqgV (UPF0045/DUF77 family)